MRVFKNREGDMDVLEFAEGDQVSEWLNASQEKAMSAVLLSKNPSLKRTALSLVQQSAETATKALARGVGMSHDYVKRSSHDHLNLFCDVLNNIVKERNCLTPLIGTTIEGDARKTLERLLDETGRNRKGKYTGAYYRFKASMQVASPSDVKVILGLLDEMDVIASTAPTLVKKVMAKSSSLEWEKGNTESLAAQAVKTVVSGLGEDVHGKFAPDDVVAALNSTFRKNSELIDLIEKANPRIDFDEDFGVDVPAPLKWAIAMVKVFMIGGLAWPHHTDVRYPSDPCAPDDPEEAARRGMLGWKHYTDEIGVILHIQRLSQILLDAVETLSRHARPNMEG